MFWVDTACIRGWTQTRTSGGDAGRFTAGLEGTSKPIKFQPSAALEVLRALWPTYTKPNLSPEPREVSAPKQRDNTRVLGFPQISASLQARRPSWHECWSPGIGTREVLGAPLWGTPLDVGLGTSWGGSDVVRGHQMTPEMSPASTSAPQVLQRSHNPACRGAMPSTRLKSASFLPTLQEKKLGYPDLKGERLAAAGEINILKSHLVPQLRTCLAPAFLCAVGPHVSPSFTFKTEILQLRGLFLGKHFFHVRIC